MKDLFSHSCFGLRSVCRVGFLLLVMATVRAESTAYSTHLQFGEPASEAAHRVETSGDVVAEVLDTEMGGHRELHRARTFRSVEASLRFEVPAPPAGRPLLIEFQEIHTRRPVVFGYTIHVNGQELYFRTYEEYGAGPNHFFVEVPPALLAGTARVAVTLRSAGGGAFSLGQVWAYADFVATTAAAEAVYRPMGLLGFRLAKEKPKPRFTSFAPIGTLTIGQYGSGLPAQVNQKMRDALAEDAAAGDTSLLLLNGGLWGGKPTGPDGLGGYFSDPRYSSLSYQPETGVVSPSWPSMWGLVAWPTFSDPWMNQYLERRFARAMSGLVEHVDQLGARGTPPRFGFVREWGAGGGEVTNFSVQRAAAAGVTLDAADGLGKTERLWMYRDGVRLWEDYATSSRAQWAWASVRVDRGEVRLPDTQVMDQLYSQPDFLTDRPMDEPRWGGGQLGMVPGMWSSGEMGKGTEYRELAMYDYVRARGRLAMVNLERPIMKSNFQPLKDHYARGFEFICLFNDMEGDAALIAGVDRCGDEPGLSAVHREPTVLSVSYARGRRLGPPERVVAANNVHVAHARALVVLEAGVPRLAVSDSGAPGEIVYRLEAPGGAFQAGLNLHLGGRISAVPGNRIEVWTGPSPDALTRVRTLTHADLPTPDRWTPHVTSETSVDLGQTMVGQRSYFLKLVLHSPSSPDAAFLLDLAVGSAWSRRSGYGDDRVQTKREQRIQQLWVQDRAVAENLLLEYARAALGAVGVSGVDTREQAAARLAAEAARLPREAGIFAEANALWTRGWYRQAYRLLCGERSQVLPARYAVRGHGPLGAYPVSVDLPGEDQTAVVTLHAVSPAGVEFSAQSERAEQSVRLRFGQLAPEATWRLETLAPNRYRVVAAAQAATGAVPLVVHDGQVSATVSVAPPSFPSSPLPQAISGRFLGGDRRAITIDNQDLAFLGDATSRSLPVVPGASVTRRPAAQVPTGGASTAWPEPFDQVDLALDELGRVTAIAATYGYDRGRIRAFHAPVLRGELAVGGIELENGRRYDFLFDALHGTRFDTVALSTSILNYELSALEQALRPGQEVEVTFCPFAPGETRPRLRTVRQSHRVLLAEDYTRSTDGAWKARAHAVDGVDVRPHQPEPNYLFDVVIPMLRPTEPFRPGQVVYRIEAGEPVGATAVEFTARAFEDSSRVTFYASRDGRTWEKCGQFDNTWKNHMPQTLRELPPQTVDLTESVRGSATFFLKVELAVHDADARFCVGRLVVRTESALPEDKLTLPGALPSRKIAYGMWLQFPCD